MPSISFIHSFQGSATSQWSFQLRFLNQRQTHLTSGTHACQDLCMNTSSPILSCQGPIEAAVAKCYLWDPQQPPRSSRRKGVNYLGARELFCRQRLQQHIYDTHLQHWVMAHRIRPQDSIIQDIQDICWALFCSEVHTVGEAGFFNGSLTQIIMCPLQLLNRWMAGLAEQTDPPSSWRWGKQLLHCKMGGDDPAFILATPLGCHVTGGTPFSSVRCWHCRMDQSQKFQEKLYKPSC